VFRWLMEAGPVAPDEMARVFNCGIGMAAIVEAERTDDVMLALAGQGEAVTRLGAVIARPGRPRVVYRGRLRAA
jgi:phosphoribosylaminoimidazole (AIR) synthetase